MTFDSELAELLERGYRQMLANPCMFDPPCGACACHTAVTETGDGWEYRCSCGYQSCNTLTEAQARSFAAMHERAR